MEILLEEVTSRLINMQGSEIAINDACWELCPAPALPLSSIKDKKRQLHKTSLILGIGMKLQFQSRRDQVHVQNRLIPDPQHVYGHNLELVHRDKRSLTLKTFPP